MYSDTCLQYPPDMVEVVGLKRDLKKNQTCPSVLIHRVESFIYSELKFL